MKPIRLQLVGRMRSGKDTICELIQELYPQVKRIAYADALKVISKDTMLLAYEVLKSGGIDISYDKFLKVINTKEYMRGFYINFGTGIVRNQISATAWYDATVTLNLSAFTRGDYVITDTRFQNELEDSAFSFDTKTIIVSCKKNVLWQRFHKDNPDTTHEEYKTFYNNESEQLYDRTLSMGNYHYEIVNNHDLEHLKLEIQKVMTLLYPGRSTSFKLGEIT